MNITSNILGELAQTIKRASPDIHETSLQVPALIQPILELRSPLRITTVSNAIFYDQSFVANIGQTITNGAVAPFDLVSCGPGVWELVFFSTYTSNFASAGGAGLIVTINTGDGVSLQLLNIDSWQAAGTTVNTVLPVKFAVPKQLQIQGSLGLAGAAQSHAHSLTVWANKLL